MHIKNVRQYQNLYEQIDDEIDKLNDKVAEEREVMKIFDEYCLDPDNPEMQKQFRLMIDENEF